MEMQTEDMPVIQKTKELCQALLDAPELRAVRQRIDAFMEDGKSRTLYDDLVAKGSALQEKQRDGLPLTDEEIGEFERHRENLLNNPVARGFVEAQQELHRVQASIRNYVSKTLELGRMPTDEEVNESSCGHGCDCHH